MNTFVIVFTCFSGIFAFGFLLAGYAALLSRDMGEIRDFQERIEQLPSRSFRAVIGRYFWLRREALPLALIITHWQTRPEVRRAIWLGLACLASALISGQFASLPK